MIEESRSSPITDVTILIGKAPAMKTTTSSAKALAAAEAAVDLAGQRAAQAKKALKLAKVRSKTAKNAVKEARKISRKAAKLARKALHHRDKILSRKVAANSAAPVPRAKPKARPHGKAVSSKSIVAPVASPAVSE